MPGLGERDWLPCITSEISGSNCTGKMIGTYGGQSYQYCRCGGKVIVRQYLKCTCENCQSSFSEMFEFCCDTCCEYRLSDRISITDPDNDELSYSFSGIGYPLAEVDDLDVLMLEAAVDIRAQFQMQDFGSPSSEF